MEGIEPRMPLSHLPAGQPDPYRPIEPAGTLRQTGEKWLTQEQALAGRRNRSEPQFAPLVPPVQYHPPAERRPFLPIPIEHSDELLA
jgi:hypothetical protein